MNHDAHTVAESETVGASLHACDQPHWRVHGKVEKFMAPSSAVHDGGVEPYEVVETTGNVLLRGGADLLWLGLIGSLTASSGAANTYFNNGNAAIGVGNSTTAATASQTDLQGASQYWKGMDATYPTHTTGTGSTAALNIQFKATYTTAQANFAWQEWSICNSTNSTGANSARRLNRKVQSLGTKSTAATWAFTVTLSLA